MLAGIVCKICTCKLVETDNQSILTYDSFNQSLRCCCFSVYKSDESISRCSEKYARNSTQFSIALASPRQANRCPSEKYQKKIAFKLETDCEEFFEIPNYSVMVTSYIVVNVNSRCRCGFSEANLKG